MTERPATWSQVVRARWTATVRCPRCPAMNQPGQKPLLDLNDDGTVFCNVCGHFFPAERPKVTPVG